MAQVPNVYGKGIPQSQPLQDAIGDAFVSSGRAPAVVIGAPRSRQDLFAAEEEEDLVRVVKKRARATRNEVLDASIRTQRIHNEILIGEGHVDALPGVGQIIAILGQLQQGQQALQQSVQALPQLLQDLETRILVTEANGRRRRLNAASGTGFSPILKLNAGSGDALVAALAPAQIAPPHALGVVPVISSVPGLISAGGVFPDDYSCVMK